MIDNEHSGPRGSSVTSLDFAGRVAVVTGAGRGIGQAYAQLLAARGAKVVVNDLGVNIHGEEPSPDAADAVVESIRAVGGEAVADHSSVASRDGAQQVIERALLTYGRVDVLVHNAGRNLGELDDMLDVHVRAGVWLTDAVWAGMAESNSGRIVLTTSASGLYGDGTGPGVNPKQPYATAKAAVIGLTRALAMRGRPLGICVNAVSPTAHTRIVGLNRGIENTREGAPASAATPDWVSANAPARLVATGALWLMHETCPVTGGLYAIGAGRVAEIFLGVTHGYVAPDGELEPEDVLAHLAQVHDRAGHHVPLDMGDYAQWVRSIVPDRTHVG
jgi:NAD(P)-dependent dehydrogenase (short-subunit alcohol dehydrogenase family)